MNFGRALPNPLSPLGRWLSRAMWWVEHAFERARASGRVEDDTSIRILFVMFTFGLGFVGLGVFATRAALFNRPVSSIAAEAAIMPRADLVDRNGQLLALDLLRYRLFVNPTEVYDVAATRRALLAVVPNISVRRLDRALAGRSSAFLVGGLSPEQRARIHDFAMPGLAFEEEQGRSYPLGRTASHVIGFSTNDGRGLAGAERAFDAPLRANGGQGQVALSIDLRVQGALEDELRRQSQQMSAIGAAGIVVNIRTGEILGLASYPDFDPNNAGTATPDTLLNRVAQARYEPGSVVKVFTLAMALDAGVANVDTLVDARTPLALSGQTIHDDHASNRMLPLWQVFTMSSNVGSARLGLMAGGPTLQRYFGAFGLFQAAPSELAESASPILTRRVTQNTIASMSFGHAIATTPLQLATGMSSVLNGGVWRPLTLRRLPSGQAPAAGRRVVSQATSRTMLDLMRRNVTEGTGRTADALGLRVGGKTGTAEKPSRGGYNRHANVTSFAAVFPTDGPLEGDRYLVLIMMDEPRGPGGIATAAYTSAPVAGRVIDRIAPFVGVRRVMLPGDVAAAAARRPGTVDPGLAAGRVEH